MLASRVRMATFKDKIFIPEGYVLAKDDDFTVGPDGSFRYIGNDLKIVIPGRIHGLAVTTYDWMFTSETGKLVEGVVSYNTNVTSMEGMFWENQAAKLDLSLFDTSNVTNMSYMFDSAMAATLDLSSFDTSKVTYMSDMFFGAHATIGYARTQADADRFNASYGKPSWLTFTLKPPLATDADFSGTSNGAFRYIGTATRLTIPHVIKGVPVTSYAGMFIETAVTEVWSNNPNVTNMSWMFEMSQATTLDLSHLDTSNVTDMTGMFSRMSATTLDVSGFDTNRVTSMEAMFAESFKAPLDLSSFDTSNFINMRWMFRDSRATIGYAKTQADANRFNATTTDRPSGLTFIVKP